MTVSDETTVVEIRTTCSRLEAALALAERLVAERLAACVQVDGPITSIYRWGGCVERAAEYRCTCKTSVERASACREAILLGHEYQTPEVLILRTQGTSAYAAWVRDSVSADP